MFCSECGNNIENGQKFCGNCGYQVQNIDAEKTTNKANCKKPKIAFIVIGIIAIIAVASAVVLAFATQNITDGKGGDTGGLFAPTPQSVEEKNKENFKDVLAEYNTYFAQGNSVGYISPDSVNSNWSKLIKPVCDELRSEGFKYLPAVKNDLPVSYCFRDVNNDGIDEMIVKAQRYGILGVYYYNADADEGGDKISFDSHFCDNTVPMDYGGYEAYLTKDNKLVEYANHNDKAFVRDLSTNPATNIVELYYGPNYDYFYDLKGNLPGKGTSTEMIDKMKAAYPEDTSVEWIKFDGKNGKQAKSVEEWWLTGTPVLTGTLKNITYEEAAKLNNHEVPPEFVGSDKKILVLVTDTDYSWNAKTYANNTRNISGKVFAIAEESRNSSLSKENYFGQETYGAFVGKHVKLIFKEAYAPTDTTGVCYQCAFHGVRCAITDYL